MGFFEDIHQNWSFTPKNCKKKPENSIDGGNLKGIYAPYSKCCVNFDKVLHSSRVKAKIIM